MKPINQNLLRTSAALSKELAALSRELAQKAITDFRRYVVGQGLLTRTQEQEKKDWAERYERERERERDEQGRVI